MRYDGEHQRRYRRDLYKFANLWTIPHTTLTNAEIISSVKSLMAKYHVEDERVVVWDVQDALNEVSNRKFPGMPTMKTRDELLSEGRVDLADMLYPNGGTIEEVLLNEDEQR